MTEPTPIPGTTRYYCPLECDWYYDQAPPTIADAAGITPDPAARDLQDVVTSIAHQASLRCAQAVEKAIGNHLETHDSVEEKKAIQRMLDAVAR